jgi:rhodanese-related sulfurtransferase
MPTIRAALEQLRAGEDVTLVEVREPGQHVLVTKEGGSVVVDVTDTEETVHVSAPIRAIESTVDQVAAASPEAQD